MVFNYVLCEYVAGLIQAGSFLPLVVVSYHNCCVLLFHSCSACGVYWVVLGWSGFLGGQFRGPFELGSSPDCLLVRGTSAKCHRVFQVL